MLHLHRPQCLKGMITFRIALRETKQANDPRPRYSKKPFANMNKDATEVEITIEFQGT
jgi:hypothetical protein